MSESSDVMVTSPPDLGTFPHNSEFCALAIAEPFSEPTDDIVQRRVDYVGASTLV